MVALLHPGAHRVIGGGVGAALVAAALVVWPTTAGRAQVPPAGAAPVTIWPKPDLFWWARSTPTGTLWLKVDAAHGAKEPLFDHQRLAIEMSLRSGNEYTPQTLPFADPAMNFVVKYDGSNAYIQQGAMAIEFILDATQWRCDLQIKWDWNRVPPTDYECLPRRPAAANPAPLPSPTAPVRSPDGTREALVSDHNVAVRAIGEAVARRLTTDGTATDAYQPGSIRWSADGGTLSAWRVHARVWESPGVTGNVKALVRRGEWQVK